MIDRLANVIYWLGCGIAILCAIGAVTALAFGEHSDYAATIFLAILALASFGVGRAVRYVLAGK